MQELIDIIRAATTSGATTEQKAAGVQACCTIVAALDTEPGQPIMSLAPSAATRPSIDQMIDLLIARLTTIATARDTGPALPAPPKVSPVVTRLPTGLRVPVMPSALPPGKPVKQPARKPAPTRKP